MEGAYLLEEMTGPFDALVEGLLASEERVAQCLECGALQVRRDRLCHAISTQVQVQVQLRLQGQ